MEEIRVLVEEIQVKEVEEIQVL
eukprot:SAG22_NODE_14238_length_380_cov_2.843416_1_plen_22_part_01